MRISVWLMLVFAALTLSACATWTKKDCENADWQKIGYIDGRHGEAADHIFEHERACRDNSVPVNHQAYERGRADGLNEYCTPAGGYTAGRSSEIYQGVCSGEKEKDFLTQYNSGRDTSFLLFERQKATDKLETKKKKIDDDHSVIGDIAKGYSLLSGQSQTKTEEDRVDDLDDKIYKHDRLAPTGAQVPRPSEIDYISTLSAVGGFGISITVGLGAGHAIQHHYFDDGWKWTAIDAAIYTGLFVVSHNCPSAPPDALGYSEPSHKEGCQTLSAVTMIAFIASRVFQGIETWPYIAKAASRYSNARADAKPRVEYVSVMPVGEAPGLGALISF